MGVEVEVAEGVVAEGVVGDVEGEDVVARGGVDKNIQEVVLFFLLPFLLTTTSHYNKKQSSVEVDIPYIHSKGCLDDEAEEED